MSKIYLSIGSLSQTPYYLSGLGVNIYSMDELCFYLVRDSYILDNDLVDTKLCDYIEEQLGLTTIADCLRNLINENAPVGEMVTTLLEKTGYCDEEEIKRIQKILVDNASLSFAAKRKLRGDNLVKAGKYTRAIEEYQYVLSSVDSSEEPDLYSAILHNIGSAYAQMFLMDKAVEFYKKAYDVNGDRESLILYLAGKRMRMKGEDFERMVVRCGYDDRVVIDAQMRLQKAENEELISEYVPDVKQIIELKSEGKVAEASRESEKVLEKWKQDYRRSMDAGYL